MHVAFQCRSVTNEPAKGNAVPKRHRAQRRSILLHVMFNGCTGGVACMNGGDELNADVAKGR